MKFKLSQVKLVHVKINWRNWIESSIVPLLSLIAFIWALKSFAGLEPNGEYYVVDDFSLMAPGSQEPAKINNLDELEFYRWSAQISSLVGREESNNGDGLPTLKAMEAEAATLAGGNAKSAVFRENMRSKLLQLMPNSVAGPFQASVWKWYRAEANYETQHEQMLGHMQANAADWKASWLAGKKFDAENAPALEKIANDRKTFIDAEMKRLADSDFPPNRDVLGAEWDAKNSALLQDLGAKRAAYMAENKEKFASGSADADAAFAKAFDILKSSKYLRPEVLQKIQDRSEAQRAIDMAAKDPICKSKNCGASDYAIYVDIEQAYKDIKRVERETDLPKDASVGFDEYTIIDASLEAVLGAYQFRNGIPISLEARTAARESTYPLDSLYEYRRETSQDMSKQWGPGAFLNFSLKQRSNKSFVNGLSDSYAVIVRGNAKEGYDILFQFLGKACFPEEEQIIDDCITETKSNFTIVMIRPIDEKRTVFKMSGRYMGQTYTSLRKPNAFYSIGLGVDRFLAGQFELNETARKTDAALAKIRAGKEVKLLSSEDGYYLPKLYDLNSVKVVGPKAAFDPKKMMPVSAGQKFYLVDGALIQLIEDRGSRDIFGYPMQKYPLKDGF